MKQQRTKSEASIEGHAVYLNVVANALMKGKLIGSGLLAISIIIGVLNISEFTTISNLLSQSNSDLDIHQRLLFVGHGLVYLVTLIVLFVQGILLIKGKNQKRNFTVFFVAIITIWLFLELPIYKCALYEIHHSFWAANRTHFH